MTKVVALVRLIPIERSNSSELHEYLAQFRLPDIGERWVTVGKVILESEHYVWKPFPGHENDFPDIEVVARDLYVDFQRSFDPTLFARYKIRKFAMEIIEGEWATGIIVPPVLSMIGSD